MPRIENTDFLFVMLRSDPGARSTVRPSGSPFRGAGLQVTIREETPADVIAVRHANAEAFRRPQEARLVERLRASDAVLLSLVAAVENRVVGHIL